MKREKKSFGSLYPGEVAEPQPELLTSTSLDRAAQWDLYRWMKLNRLLEDRMASLYRRGMLVGGAYSSRGQEATSVGSAYALEAGDLIGPLIRNLGAQLVRGVEPKRVFALHMAKATSVSRGKDNLPPTDLAKGILGPIAMLGSLMSVVAGAVLAARMKGESRVGMTWIGDGATSTGEFHEAMNLIAVLDLPMVVIVENNGYAYSTPTAQQMRVKDIALRAAGYGMASEIVDGNDVLAVYEASRRAVARARKGGGPTFLESKTFRMKGHAEHDDASYVPAELRAHWEAKDPLARMERHLEALSFARAPDFEALEQELGASLDQDIQFAIDSPLPAPEQAAEGVYEPVSGVGA
jgi:TPP-dependent pyruvate/acetoin dehydrogenase alpha subunit